MKIIFDSEEQKEKFIRIMRRYACPRELILLESEDCSPMTSCSKCWEKAIDMEVRE